MTCPTCGGHVEEVWREGRHPFAFGPEASACGRCGAGPRADVHRPEYVTQLPPVDDVAEALHAAADSPCETDHAADGRSGVDSIRHHHRAHAEAVLGALADVIESRGGPRPRFDLGDS